MDYCKGRETAAFEWLHYKIYACLVGTMSNVDILEAIEDEDLGSVRRWLNSNTGRANVNKILNSNKTILNRALEIASNYSARDTFAHRIVNLLRERGAQTKQDLELTLPPISTPNIFEAGNIEPNIFYTPLPNQGKPPLAPRRQLNQMPEQSRKRNGIAFGPRRNKRNSRKRRGTLRSRRN